MTQNLSEGDWSATFDDINFPEYEYEEINLNEKLAEELKISETLCNQLRNKYESLGKYYNHINNILSEKQELKNTIVDLNQTNDHNSKLIKVLVKTLEERSKEIQEKDNVIQEKDCVIQEKDNVIQEKDCVIQENNVIQEKDCVIQEKDNIIQERGYMIQEKDCVIQENDREIQKIQEKYNAAQEKNRKIQKIQEKDKIIQEKDSVIQEKDSVIQEKDSVIQEKDCVIQEMDKKIKEIRLQNKTLTEESSKYQYENNKNNSAALKYDITNLQHSLENYITKCKGNVDININEIQKLLKKYESNSVITKDHKPLIKAVLQRHVIEQIFKYGEEYFQFANLNKYKKYGSGTETYLYNKANELINLAEIFAAKRDGVDETTKLLPVKLRQIFAALGNRGFNKVIKKKKKTSSHEFISEYQDILNEEINKYRKFGDPERKREIEDMAGSIIQKVINLFWFRLEVQEPIAEYIWFKYNDKIDPSYMEGTWEDDEIDKIVVDICYFPVIAQEFDKKSKRQIYTPAGILHKYK
ncbi:hypothetical protein C1645_877970 [Glomus cerebriforme]|uniref:Uncharacterized protein n=1 Tax=Glomus cerebriforme TaxID=658196 RepID=A0A397SRJ3_9GLOM|nr:hypothetical protein C1645_877970 [Glomus cerebriforme]